MNSTPAGTLAIIGAGQLGFFLCNAARELGFRTLIVTADAAAPALGVADDALLTPLDAPDLAAAIAARAQFATFEFENVPDALLADLAQLQAQGQIAVRPDPTVLGLLKNKARQKRWLASHGFPTLPFEVFDELPADAATGLTLVRPPLVQKAQQGGYDGYGVQVLRTAADLERLWPVPSLVEPFLDKVREVAVLAARSADGDIKVYAPTDLEFEPAGNILDWVLVPAALPAPLQASARQLAADIVSALDGVGVFAVEMFLVTDADSPEGRLVVNEISPRVHNAGHHTLESCPTSQFAQHVRAVTGMPLGPVEQTASATMHNLLYRDELESLCAYGAEQVPTSDPAVALHWYGKREARPGRKMGHITCTGLTPEAAKQQISVTLSTFTAVPKGATA
jgi:5-(carboxyamino)imidazole ribonucleotide synthase